MNNIKSQNGPKADKILINVKNNSSRLPIFNKNITWNLLTVDIHIKLHSFGHNPLQQTQVHTNWN